LTFGDAIARIPPNFAGYGFPGFAGLDLKQARTMRQRNIPMNNRASILILCAFLLQLGCVGQSAYQKKVEETTCLTRDLVDMQRRNTELAKENEKLASETASLKGRVGELEEGKQKLEKLLSEKSEAAYATVSQLEKENTALKFDLEKLLRAREERVRGVSRTYEGLLDRMKEEISGGRLTVSELRGKLTISIRDDLLFNREKAELSAPGKTALQKIADLVKELRGSEVNVIVPYEIHSGLQEQADKMGKAAESSAGRAVMVATFLSREGIDSGNLRASAIGSFEKTFEPGSIQRRLRTAFVEIAVTVKE